MQKRMFTNIQTGEVMDALPPLDCVKFTPLKKYNKQEYRRRKFKELRSRILLEYRFQKSKGWFVTLTYDDRKYPDCEEQLYKDLDLFLKRLRRFQEYNFPNYHEKIKYFAVIEKSKECTKRWHHHLIIYGLHPNVSWYMCRSNSFMENIWNNGFVTSRPLLPCKLWYLVKYLFKEQDGVIYKYHCSKGFGYNGKFISRNIKQFGKAIFRFGKFWYKIPRTYVLKSLRIRIPLSKLKKKCYEEFEYYNKIRACTSIFFGGSPNYESDPCLVLHDNNMFEVVPRCVYNNYVKQLEYNRL